MPNIDEHYQNEKKKLRKGKDSSSNSRGFSKGMPSINGMKRVTVGS